MDRTKILSIVIPTYNMEKYLHKCLDSLVVSDENMQLLEILVVNDGSRDSSSSIGHEYEAKYPQTFRVIDKENGNYGSCINRGLKEATGKYVKVLDADDYSISQNLDEYLTFLSKIDVDAVITDFNIVNDTGVITDIREFSSIFEESESVVLFPELLQKKDNIAFQMHAITYKLSILRKMEYQQTEGISYTDQEWSTIPMMGVNTICYFHRPIYNYLIGREGQTMANYFDVTNHKQLFQVVEKIANFYEEFHYDESYNIYIENKLKKVLTGIYEAGLKFYSISKDELLSYDSLLLRKYPKTYGLADELKLYKGHISYVRYWRSKNQLALFFLVKIPVCLRNFVKK